MTNRNDIEQIFKAHYERMHRLAVTLLHDDDMARDIVHDVFASLLEHPAEITPGSGYLLTAVRNRCLNRIRDCGIHERIHNLWFLDDNEYDTEEWPDEETIELIHRLIQSEVSPQGRRVIELRFAGGMPFAKIAALMGISETAVYRHLRHALRLIRQKLNDHGQI